MLASCTATFALSTFALAVVRRVLRLRNSVLSAHVSATVLNSVSVAVPARTAARSAVHAAVGRVLAPDMPPLEAAAACADDWRGDLRGGERMTFQKYVLSIFEIADLWTDSVNELDCAPRPRARRPRARNPRRRTRRLRPALRGARQTSS